MDSNDTPQRKRLDLTLDTLPGPEGDDTFEALETAANKGSVFSRMSAAFHDALQSGRGEHAHRDYADSESAGLSADDLAIRRAKNVNLKQMIVPEGVIIGGSMTSGSETEISGRVEGDVIVDGRLHLGPSALITGNVRATFCHVEGLVEGKLECSQELDLGKTGRVNADAMAGKGITIAGQIRGNVTTGGMMRLLQSGRVEGNVFAKRIVIEEGALFNGTCTMRAPAQRAEKPVS